MGHDQAEICNREVRIHRKEIQLCYISNETILKKVIPAGLTGEMPCFFIPVLNNNQTQ